MTKKRPVVVISRPHRELSTVVPLSTTEPVPIEKCHHEVRDSSLPRYLLGKRHWAKCDVVTTVAFWRLDRVRDGRHSTTGKRMYTSHPVCQDDLTAILAAVSHVLGLDSS